MKGFVLFAIFGFFVQMILAINGPEPYWLAVISAWIISIILYLLVVRLYRLGKFLWRKYHE